MITLNVKSYKIQTKSNNILYNNYNKQRSKYIK